jgi:hypothetical protein
MRRKKKDRNDEILPLNIIDLAAVVGERTVQNVCCGQDFEVRLARAWPWLVVIYSESYYRCSNVAKETVIIEALG